VARPAVAAGGLQGAPDARYGAHVWLKLPDSPQLGEPPTPEDAYYMLGYDEQVVAVVPSRDLVIVRLGLTREGGAWDHTRVLAPIVQAFPPHREDIQSGAGQSRWRS
jgi:CubicO group peptidase (beta-lactamase class C family)